MSSAAAPKLAMIGLGCLDRRTFVVTEGPNTIITTVIATFRRWAMIDSSALCSRLGAVTLALGWALFSGPSLAAALAPHGGSVSAQWQARTLNFTYTGFTTLYTCDGLEGKVREILLALGARKDAKVHATGCDLGRNAPSRFAWVEAKFSALAPGSDASAADAIKSVWSTVEISPNRPSFMGAGDCELMEGMRDVLPKGFSMRNVQYRTSCTPHQVSLGAFAVKVEVLKAEPHAQ